MTLALPVGAAKLALLPEGAHACGPLLPLARVTLATIVQGLGPVAEETPRKMKGPGSSIIVTAVGD